MKYRVNTILHLFLLAVLGASCIVEQKNKVLLSFKILALVILAGNLGWKVLTMPTGKPKKFTVHHEPNDVSNKNETTLE